MSNLLYLLNKKILDSCNRVSSTKLLKLVKEKDSLYLQLINQTSFLPEDTDPIERYHCLRLGYKNRPVCKYGKYLNFNKSKKLYYEFCSINCKCKISLHKDLVQASYLNISKKNINDIKNQTSFLPDTASLSERLYCINNNILKEEDIPKCQCGNSVKYTNDKYNKFCSDKKCIYKIKHLQKESKKACLKRYGVDNPFKSTKIQESIKKTNINKYGVDNPFKSKKIQNKLKETWQKTKGIINPGQCPIVKSKIKTTNLKKRGFKSTLSDPKIKDKIYKTNIKKYGYKNPIKSKKVRDKLKKTLAAKNKSRILYSQQHLPVKFLKLRKNKKLYRDLLEIWNNDLKLMQLDIAEHFGVHPSLIQKDFKKFKIKVKLHYTSKFEKDIKCYIKSITNLDIKSRHRDFGRQKELDLYIPNLNLAIEANGNFWHSYKYLPNKAKQHSHFFKTQFCKEKGIRLLHIFQSDWDHEIKGKIWRSILKINILGAGTKIYARNTKVMCIDSKTANNFLKLNHLQGSTKSTLYLGLMFKNELVMVMAFINNKQYWNLTRMASKLDTQIIGGASKLFKNFIKQYNPKEVITFADLMYSYGDVYYNLGFNKVSQTAPKHYYTDKKAIFHCRNFQKNKLKKLLGNKFDSTKTEIANVLYNTNLRIFWDSGKLKFVWKNV